MMTNSRKPARARLPAPAIIAGEITPATVFEDDRAAIYQTLINEALREYIRRGGIEAAMRRAVRKKLRGTGVKKTAGG